jgi:hypothetical protein
MRQYTRLDDLTDENEYKLLRDRYLHLKKQLASAKGNDTSLLHFIHQTEMKMLQSQLKVLRNVHKKTAL